MSEFEAQPAHHHPVQSHTSALFASSCRTTAKWKSTMPWTKNRSAARVPGVRTRWVYKGYNEAYTDSEEERHG